MNKKIEEAAERYSEYWDDADAFKAGAEWALNNQWISVDERLPDKNQRVNVKLNDGVFTNSFLLDDGFWAFNVEPTHWMPIH